LKYIIFDKGTSILEGRTSFGELKSDTKANFIPLYIADCLVFIPVQIINFRYISPYYRVPFMFFIAFIYNAFISAYKHTDEK
jgi:protein Mpv17